MNKNAFITFDDLTISVPVVSQLLQNHEIEQIFRLTSTNQHSFKDKTVKPTPKYAL